MDYGHVFSLSTKLLHSSEESQISNRIAAHYGIEHFVRHGVDLLHLMSGIVHALSLVFESLSHSQRGKVLYTTGLQNNMQTGRLKGIAVSRLVVLFDDFPARIASPTHNRRQEAH